MQARFRHLPARRPNAKEILSLVGLGGLTAGKSHLTDHRGGASFDKLRLRKNLRGTKKSPHAELVEARTMPIQANSHMRLPRVKGQGIAFDARAAARRFFHAAPRRRRDFCYWPPATANAADMPGRRWETSSSRQTGVRRPPLQQSPRPPRLRVPKPQGTRRRRQMRLPWVKAEGSARGSVTFASRSGTTPKVFSNDGRRSMSSHGRR
jgi:hypothetical protein